MKPVITVFTPTFNRAALLPRLYESLVSQTQVNLEWVLVDDGSTDCTPDLIRQYIKENKIPIRYVKQDNQGKHVAINQGIKLAKGAYFLIIDSDDFLLPNCIEVCNGYIEKIKEEPAISGFSFIRFTTDINYDKKKYGKKEWLGEIDYPWEHHGEMCFCYKTEIFKNYPFPQFRNEKFCPESLVHRRIEKKFDVLFTDHVLVRGDYLEDGLSSKYWQLVQKSPKTCMIVYEELINDPKTTVAKRDEAAKIFIGLALSEPRKHLIGNLSRIPLGYTAKVFINKLFKK